MNTRVGILWHFDRNYSLLVAPICSSVSFCSCWVSRSGPMRMAEFGTLSLRFTLCVYLDTVVPTRSKR